MVLALVPLIARVAVLSYRWAPAVTAALRALVDRGLSRYELNQLRESLIATGSNAFVKELGEINQVLQALK